mmetsp:Transcript_35585/g.57985  ORF Transcript_35585/g.57985 Transcript_35585/m.57985 type:complete len:135 (+) Transcript_35585:1182-1586(+)
MKPDVAAAILTAQQQKEQPHKQSFVDGQDDKEEVDDDGPCWYEVIERLPNKQALNTAYDNSNQSPLTDANNGEQVIALSPTKREALECLRLSNPPGAVCGGKFGWWISCTKALEHMKEGVMFLSILCEAVHMFQ